MIVTECQYQSISNIFELPKMSDFAQGINDEHLMDKLQQIVPELRKQIQTSIRNKFEMSLQKLKEQKRKELTQQYQLKIKQRVEERNSQIKNSLASLVQMIDNYKVIHKQKNRQMSKEEEGNFIQQTVDEILSDQNMIEEVKNRLRSKIEGKVRSALEKQLEEGVEMGKRQLSQKIKQQRQTWTQQRITFWREQSNRELQQLASHHSQLNKKKLSIQAALTSKKGQRSQLQQRLSMIMQKNAMVSNLRRQIKNMKDKIRGQVNC